MYIILKCETNKYTSIYNDTIFCVANKYMYVYVCLMYVLLVSRSKSEGKTDPKEEVKV